jgi:hypothetical protein
LVTAVCGPAPGTLKTFGNKILGNFGLSTGALCGDGASGDGGAVAASPDVTSAGWQEQGVHASLALAA